MPPSKFTYDLPSEAPNPVIREAGVEYSFTGTLQRRKSLLHPALHLSNRDSMCYFANNAHELLNNARRFTGQTELRLAA